MDIVNIALIGMAGVGKSTVGSLLAETLGWSFIDIDRILEQERGKPLQEILNELGDEGFVEAEASKVQEYSRPAQQVIAPGGSIVYSESAMRSLKDASTVVYLKATAALVEKRINTTNRGIVGLKDRNFAALYAEREKLYEQHADLIVNVDDKSLEEIVSELLAAIKTRR